MRAGVAFAATYVGHAHAARHLVDEARLQRLAVGGPEVELADAAVKKVPTEPRFRGTRGHILAKMNRNKEALDDLQESAKAYPKDPNLFKTLSDVSTKLGFTRMAEDYLKEAERLSGLAGQTIPGDKLSPTAPAPKTRSCELVPWKISSRRNSSGRGPAARSTSCLIRDTSA